MKKFILPLIMILTLFSSCSTHKKILYLQDNVIDSQVQTITNGEIRFKPGDVISIFVSSRNPELAAVFNLSYSSNNNSSGESNLLSYTIDDKGNIDFPVLGEIRAEGYTKIELARNIKKMILESEMINDPTVIVNYQNLSFSTIGEVSRPGNYSISKDKTTIFEALSLSGDLSINGVRDRVFVTRRVNNSMMTYQVDLRSKDIYQSPAFYVQQNDVIYVEPSKIKTNQSTANGNTVRSASFWMSLASFLTSMTLIFIN
ncbi:MAG: polysaccharide biosynthesis/export family protein [Rikenellaceae bacterium]